MKLPNHLVRWGPTIEAVCDVYSTSGLDPYILAAICDRESGGGRYLTPKDDPNGWGDAGNGFGLMQIDRRYHKPFLDVIGPNGNKLCWRPVFQFMYAAEILDYNESITGNWMSAIAAYNASMKRVLAAIQDINPDAPEYLAACDSVTTGKNYVSDVLARANKWRST